MIAELMAASSGDDASGVAYGRLLFVLVGVVLLVVGRRLMRDPERSVGRTYVGCGLVLVVLGLIWFGLSLVTRA